MINEIIEMMNIIIGENNLEFNADYLDLPKLVKILYINNESPDENGEMKISNKFCNAIKDIINTTAPDYGNLYRSRYISEHEFLYKQIRAWKIGKNKYAVGTVLPLEQLYFCAINHGYNKLMMLNHNDPSNLFTAYKEYNGTYLTPDMVERIILISDIEKRLNETYQDENKLTVKFICKGMHHSMAIGSIPLFSIETDDEFLVKKFGFSNTPDSAITKMCENIYGLKFEDAKRIFGGLSIHKLMKQLFPEMSNVNYAITNVIVDSKDNTVYSIIFRIQYPNSKF